MPQFSLRLLLILFAVVAVWLSTGVNYPGSYDVRHSIVLLIVAASAAKLYASNGRNRCFWMTFGLALFVSVVRQDIISPNLVFLKYAVRPLVTSVDIYGDMQMPMPSAVRVDFIADTFSIVFDLLLATAAGYIGTYLYDQSRTSANT